MQPCLKITNGSYNLLIKKLLHQFKFYRCCGDSTNADENFITNPRLMISTRLFATAHMNVVPRSTMNTNGGTEN